jgi:hypothetical protein
MVARHPAQGWTPGEHARGAQDLYDRPGPKGTLFFERQVAAPPGGFFVNEDAGRPRAPDKPRAGNAECLSGLAVERGPEEVSGLQAMAVERGHEGGEHGQQLSSPCVHA